MTKTELSKLSTTELLAAYNELTGEKVTRFASREAGEKRYLKALESKGAETAEKAVKTASGQAATGAERPAPSPTPAPKAGKAAATSSDSPADRPAKGKKPKMVLVEVAPGKSELFPADSPEAKAQLAKKLPARATTFIERPSPEEQKRAMAKFQKDQIGCPVCGADEDKQIAAGKPGSVAGDERHFCNHCGSEYWTATGLEFKSKRPGSGLGGKRTSASWGDPAVRAARSVRTSVEVDGVQYKSAVVAFRELRLPMEKVVKFRMALKAAGKATFTNDKGKEFKFKVVK